MPALKLMFGVAAATAVLLSAAQAATLINRDSAAHTLRIVEGDQERIVSAEPSQQISKLCASACSLYFGDDPEAYEIAAGDIVSIEDGQLFFEDPSLQLEPPAEQTDEAPPKQ